MEYTSILVFLNYAMSFLMMCGCIILLKRTRYLSLLSYFVLANIVQVGLGLGYLPEYLIENNFTFDEYAYQKYIIAQILYVTITGGLLFLFFPRSSYVGGDEFELKLIYRWDWIFLVVGGVFLYLRVSSPASLHVLGNLGAAFSSDHYSVRSELIYIGNDAYSRFNVHFINFSRAFLTLGLLVFSYNGAIYKNSSSKWVAIFLLIILIIDGLLKLQKAPVVILALITYAPFFLKKIRDGDGTGKGSEKRFLYYVGMFVAVTFLTAVFFVSYVFQDMTIEQGIFLFFDRLIFIPGMSTIMHFRAYPDIIPHVNMAGMNFIAKLFDLTTMPVYGSIALDVAQANTGVLYNANAGILANAWANFGYAGVIFYSVLSFFVLLAIDYYVLINVRRMPIWPLAAYFAAGFVVYGNIPFEDVLLLQGLLFMPIVYVFLVHGSKSMSGGSG